MKELLLSEQGDETMGGRSNYSAALSDSMNVRNRDHEASYKTFYQGGKKAG